MAILGSSRNLVIFGGLGVFALGWGGGLLLGAFSAPDAPPKTNQPQLVDADAYSSESDAQKSNPAETKPSSLLEQVFGLDDLEEERATPTSRAVGREATTQSPTTDDNAAAPSVPKEQAPVSGGTTTDAVKLEEEPAPTEVPPTEKWNEESGLPPEPSQVPGPAPEAAPEKDILSENPYK